MAMPYFALPAPNHLFSLLILALLFSVSDVQAFTQEIGGEDYAIYKERMKHLLSLLDEKTPVAIIRFETDYWEGTKIVNGKQEKVQVPASGAAHTEDQPVLKVFGTFFFEATLNGSPPRAGHIRETILLKSGRLDRNKEYTRVQALLPRNAFGITKPVRCLAVWPKATSKVLDGAFFGPISERNVKEMTEVAELLKKQPFSEITAEKAESLLDSPNPWVVYVALVRLEDIKALSSKHFARAIKSMPPQNTGLATRELVDWTYTSVKNGKKVLTQALTDILGKIEPEKETILLRYLNDTWRQPYFGASFHVNLPELQKAAQAYRAKIVKDAKRREVVRELDALIDLRSAKQ
jgi:hypothetical protein